MKYKANESKSTINIGIQLLRIVLSFWVVTDHCLYYQIKISYKIFFKNRLHVPCFIVISFFFSYKTISSRNFFKIKQRFIRLIIPYFVLPIIIAILNNLSFFLFKISYFGSNITLQDLLKQFIIGRKIIYVFWYQFYMIWTTLFFVIISIIMKTKYLIVIAHIYLISYIIRYSDVNYQFFNQYSLIIRNSVGELNEVMPMSVSGSIIASSNLLQIIQISYKKVIYFSCVGLFIILKYNIFSDINFFAFGGIILDVGSVLIFIIFYLLPLTSIKSLIINKIIKQIAKYTQGIYSIHQIIRFTLISKFNSIKKGTFIGVIIVYIFSFFISFIGEKITKKTKLVYLFI